MNESEADYIYLAERPDLIPVLAAWFYDEWGTRNPDLSREIIEGKLKGRLNRDKVPLVFVRILNETPIASTSIKIREMETHPQYLHWLGSVYVLPEYRGQGIGTNLVQHTIQEAERLAVNKLYLYTRNKEDFYLKFGWQSIETPIYHGRRVTIMRLNLSV